MLKNLILYAAIGAAFLMPAAGQTAPYAIATTDPGGVPYTYWDSPIPENTTFLISIGGVPEGCTILSVDVLYERTPDVGPDVATSLLVGPAPDYKVHVPATPTGTASAWITITIKYKCPNTGIHTLVNALNIL